MNKFLKELLFYIIFSILIASVASAILQMQGRQTYPFLHIIYYFFIVMVIFLVLNPKSMLYKVKVYPNRSTLVFIIAATAITSVLCVIPMGINPVWNGEIPDYKNEYEELADALLEGHLNVHAGEDTSALSAMDNPYSYEARLEQDIAFHWDHAFYKGNYYVYFGIVPAIVLFLPYRLFFGEPLTSWKATAVFSVFIIIAVFMLGYKLIKKLQSEMPIAVYLMLSTSLSLVILWYAIKYPALYCTALTSGICFALWALYFIMDAFWMKEKPGIWEICAGSLCGALVFGCRPPKEFQRSFCCRLYFTPSKNSSTITIGSSKS